MRWDGKNPEAFANLFARSAMFDWVIGGKPERARIEGKADIEAYARDSCLKRPGGKQTRHHLSNLVLRPLSPDHAVTEHTVMVTHQRSGQRPEHSAGGFHRIGWQKFDQRG